MTSPVEVLSPLFYVDAVLSEGAELALPTDYEERAVYVVEGALQCGSERFEASRLIVFERDADVVLRADGAARIVLLGGEPLEGERYMDWNFVSNSKERLQRARDDWGAGRFPSIPGDDDEPVPAPPR